MEKQSVKDPDKITFSHILYEVIDGFLSLFARNNYINIFVFKLSKKNSKKLFTFFSKHDMMILC